jgi:hypothetical protein
VEPTRIPDNVTRGRPAVVTRRVPQFVSWIAKPGFIPTHAVHKALVAVINACIYTSKHFTVIYRPVLSSEKALQNYTPVTV